MKDLVVWWERRNQRHQDCNCVCNRGGVCASYESLGRALGVSHSTLFRRFGKNHHGNLTIAEADVWAVRLGVHPSAIWPRWDRMPVHASLSQPNPTWGGGL